MIRIRLNRRIAVIALLVLVLAALLVELRVRSRREELVRAMIDEIRSECGQSSALIAESHQLNRDLAPGGYWQEDDFAGEFYNFKNGERLVVGARTDAPYTIWIFGNSGTMDLHLADRDTFATHLQKYFTTYRVRNRSAEAQAITGQLAWLKKTPVQRGDLVLFIDGVMDKDEPIPALIAQAERYTLERGAGFWHFRQPFVFQLDTPGIPIVLDKSLFIEYAHLNELGAIAEARKVYDQLSIY